MANKLELMLEAERRGILPEDKKALLAEARSRGLIDAPAPEAEKTRSWSDVPGEALTNLPASAKGFAEAVAFPFTNPKEFATGVKDLTVGAGSKIVGLASDASEAVGGPQLPRMDPETRATNEAAINQVGQFIVDRYGSVDALKETLATDPVGAAADIAAVLGTGGAALPGRAGTAVKAAASAIDPLANTARAARFTGRRAANILGQSTGAGTLPVETAFEAGRQGSQVFRDNLRGKADINDTVAMADRGVSKLTAQRQADYVANDPLGGEAARSPLNTDPIKQKLADSQGMARFQGIEYNPEAAKVLDRVQALIQRFEDAPSGEGRAAIGLDKLKQGIYQIAKNEPPGSPSSKIAMDVYHAIGDTIRDQVPQYDKAMRDYRVMSNLINEMKRTLSLNDKATLDTKARKLQSVMRNNVNTNYGQRTRLVDELSKLEPDLPAALAGQALSSPTPRGLQGVGGTATIGTGIATMNPLVALTLPAFSPRAVGEAAYYAGRGTQTVADIMKRTGMTPQEAARYLAFMRLVGETGQAAQVEEAQ